MPLVKDGFENLSYIRMPLNRHSAERERTEWITQQLLNPSALFLPIWKHLNLTDISRPEKPGLFLLEMPRVRSDFDNGKYPVYLGHLGNDPVFSAGIDADDETAANNWAAGLGLSARFVDLRHIGPLLKQQESAIMAYARGLHYWHSQNGHCSRCGTHNESRRGGHVRICMNADCGREAYPHINPAVIMLVEQARPNDGIPRCLLGRHSGLPKKVYSTLAGYVDPGETLEEAVAREVLEEAGIHIDDAHYLASQPWPFPSSMMFGFHATTSQSRISVDNDELEDAQWFTREELLGFGEYDDPDSTLALPRRDSIARNLINLWIDKYG
ncbi:MAG: NAD(+) diphosphatase [Pseudomonadota bacterium]